MSWVITGSEKTPVDLQFTSVSLLLHGNGTNGSTTITDSSSNALTLTRGGSALPVISTAQSKFGGASIFLNGSGAISYLDIPASSLFSFPSDFTFECWIYVLTQGPIFGSTVIETAGNFTNGLVLRGDGTQTNWAWTVGGSGISGGALTLNAWNHLAVSRSGSTIRVFRDGVQEGTATNSTPISPTGGASRIGEGMLVTNRFVQIYIDNILISKGVALYTANFTPPTAPFPDI
jgi:hypothetical protein